MKSKSIFMAVSPRWVKVNPFLWPLVPEVIPSLCLVARWPRRRSSRGLQYTPHYAEPYMQERRRELLDPSAGVYRYDHGPSGRRVQIGQFARTIELLTRQAISASSCMTVVVFALLFAICPSVHSRRITHRHCRDPAIGLAPSGVGGLTGGGTPPCEPE